MIKHQGYFYNLANIQKAIACYKSDTLVKLFLNNHEDE